MSKTYFIGGCMTVSFTLIFSYLSLVYLFNKTDEVISTVENVQIKMNISESKECKRFVFDRPNWTMYLKNVKELDLFCEQKLNSLLSSAETKLIVHADGKKEYRGCTKHTNRCKDAPHFDKLHGVRINTPPCCAHHIKEIFRNFVEELKTENIGHIIVFGGVLGWKRNGKMIPYDGDLDLVIEKIFWNSTKLQSVMAALIKKYNYHLYFRDGGKKLSITLSKTNYNGIDIWPYDVETFSRGSCAMVTIPHVSWKPMSLDVIFPLRRVSFEGIETFVPQKTSKFLHLIYGKHWQQELDCKNVDVDGKCCSPRSKQNFHNMGHRVCFFLSIAFLLALILYRFKKRKLSKDIVRLKSTVT